MPSRFGLAFKDNRPVAAVVTIRHKDTMVLQIRRQRPQLQSSGQHALAALGSDPGGQKLRDCGSSTSAGPRPDQQGLITFKKRWGTAQSDLIYSRYSLSDDVTQMFEASATNWKSRVAKLLACPHAAWRSFSGRPGSLPARWIRIDYQTAR